jgi:hypothetical protein
MISYNNIISKIYSQMIAVDKQGLKPYYLFLSRYIFNILEAEMLKTDLFKETGKVEFFEGLEIVSFVSAPEDYIEIKGLKLVNAK